MTKKLISTLAILVILTLPTQSLAGGGDGGSNDLNNAPSRNVSRLNCKELQNELDRQRGTEQHLDVIELTEADYALGASASDVRTANQEITRLEGELQKTSDKAEKKKIRSELWWHKKRATSSERDVKKYTRQVAKLERTLKRIQDNIRALEAHILRNGC